MKKALHKDFWMEIRKSKARFISIFFIVALGVAFFSGIQAASPDMRLSGDAYYDESKLMDIKVVGTMGLTSEDVDATASVKGVQEAEGAYSTDVMCGEEDAQKVLHLESMNQTVNQLTVNEGRLPEKSGECFVDNLFADSMDYKVGDELHVRQQEDSDLLKTEKYTIVGIGSSPLYISFNRGNTTLGTGEINGFAYVLPEDFDQEVFTQIYLRVHGAEGLTSYTDAYDNLIAKIQDRVEGIEKERCQIRYDSVVSDAQEELDDAKKELDDGKKKAKKELADARKEIKDGEKELADGKKEYEDGKQELADAKQEVADGWNQIDDAKAKLADGWALLESGKNQLADARNQLADAKAQLADGWEQINENQAKLDDGYKQLNQGKKELEAGRQQIEDARADLNQKQAELDAGRQAVADGKIEIENTRSALAAQKQECEAGLAQVAEGEAALSQGEAALADAQAQLAALQEQYAQAEASGQYSEEELAQMAQNVANVQAQVEGQAAELEARRQELAATRSELENGLASIEAGYAQLDQKQAELEAMESQFEPNQQLINEGFARLETEADKLKPAEKEIQKNQKTLDANQKTLDGEKKKLSDNQATVDAKAQELAQAEAEAAASEQELAAAEDEIAANEQKLADGEQEIEDNEKKLADAQKDIEEAEKELKNGKKEYQDAKKDADKEIADNEKKLEDAQKELDDLKLPEWIVTDRNNLPEYSDYGDNAERIRNIGQVFPVIFFLVAALISLTTMTRMVEEQRTQIGTMKALGYGKYAIASKYLNYAFLATVGGSALGVVIGEKILPYIIIKAYGIMYHNMASNLQIHYEFKFAMIASVAAVVCTIGATVTSCYKALVETPASLMRPPAPKEGKRVLIERATFIWKHLSFTWKSTLRNLFRYKKRLLMTIFGIAGSMALMLVGFGLQDSIMDIAVRQYDELQHYEATIISDEDATAKEKEELDEFLKKNEQISRFTKVQLTKMDAPRNNSNISVYIYVPENLENFHEDVTLQNRITKEPYELTDAGAAVSEKTASLLGLDVGDELTLKKDNQEYRVNVAVITENYMGHYVYMTPHVYEQTFGEKPDYANTVFTMKEEFKDRIDDMGNEILKYPAALSISYTSSLAGQLERMLSSLKTVIVVLIVSAGMLAFVVLYNLNNINITERQRELATLKVLGFFDKEVSQYVFRENILLTLIGVLAGAVFGILLHRFVIVTVEVDAVMFGRNIKALSFVYSGLFTCGFSAFVNMAMHFKLKKINMVESLKSVE